MPLYCYIIETGMYEDVESHVLGHSCKYSQEEFDKLCIEIMEKHGYVEENAYFSSYDKCDVEEIRYEIDPYRLIKFLINDYGFVELTVPIQDGHYRKEVSRTPVPPERLQKVVVKSHTCPAFEGHIFCTDNDTNFSHPNARCNPFYKKEDSVD